MSASKSATWDMRLVPRKKPSPSCNGFITLLLIADSCTCSQKLSPRDSSLLRSPSRRLVSVNMQD